MIPPHQGPGTTWGLDHHLFCLLSRALVLHCYKLNTNVWTSELAASSGAGNEIEQNSVQVTFAV